MKGGNGGTPHSNPQVVAQRSNAKVSKNKGLCAENSTQARTQFIRQVPLTVYISARNYGSRFVPTSILSPSYRSRSFLVKMPVVAPRILTNVYEGDSEELWFKGGQLGFENLPGWPGNRNA